MTPFLSGLQLQFAIPLILGAKGCHSVGTWMLPLMSARTPKRDDVFLDSALRHSWID